MLPNDEILKNSKYKFWEELDLIKNEHPSKSELDQTSTSNDEHAKEASGRRKEPRTRTVAEGSALRPFWAAVIGLTGLFMWTNYDALMQRVALRSGRGAVSAVSVSAESRT